jgi:hypothetical protein
MTYVHINAHIKAIFRFGMSFVSFYLTTKKNKFKKWEKLLELI